MESYTVPALLPTNKVPSDSMGQVLERADSRLERLEGVLEEQNEILRKELHGIQSSSDSENSFDLTEAKTLRELVEEIHFDVKSLSAKLTNIERNQEAQAKMISKIKSKLKFAEEDYDGSARNELGEQFGGVEIRSKTLEEEKNWLKGKFYEMRAKSEQIRYGVSFQERIFQGRSLKTISNSIPLSGEIATSCVLKLSNHLNEALIDSQFYGLCDTKMTGPSTVAGHFTEVFVGSGSPCYFVGSFSVSNSLRMTLCFANESNGTMCFMVGFTPENISTDHGLFGRLCRLEHSPDLVKNHPRWVKKPAELFVTTGQFLVRGQMKTEGSRSVVLVDILEMTHHPANGASPSFQYENMSSDLKQTIEKISKSLRRRKTFPGKISCTVKIFNLINVKLRSEETFYLSSQRNNYKSNQVQPFQGATFFASDHTSVEGMFSFQIESTDLSLVIGFNAQGKENCFAGAFLPHPTPTASKQELEKMMYENHWKLHEWRRFAKAIDGEQVLQIRNILAVISMTEGRNSVLKIQVFTF